MAGRVFRGLPRAFKSALGEAITYTPAGGDAEALTGIFTADFYAPVEGGEVQVESAAPAVSLPSADVPAAAQGDAVTVGETDYKVVSVQPDGMGMTALILREV
jgi:hypothetical protein